MKKITNLFKRSENHSSSPESEKLHRSDATNCEICSAAFNLLFNCFLILHIIYSKNKH